MVEVIYLFLEFFSSFEFRLGQALSQLMGSQPPHFLRRLRDNLLSQRPSRGSVSLAAELHFFCSSVPPILASCKFKTNFGRSSLWSKQWTKVLNHLHTCALVGLNDVGFSACLIDFIHVTGNWTAATRKPHVIKFPVKQGWISCSLVTSEGRKEANSCSPRHLRTNIWLHRSQSNRKTNQVPREVREHLFFRF